MVRRRTEGGSYLRRIDFVYNSTLGLRVIKKVLRSRANMFRYSLGVRISDLRFGVSGFRVSSPCDWKKPLCSSGFRVQARHQQQL